MSVKAWYPLSWNKVLVLASVLYTSPPCGCPTKRAGSAQAALHNGLVSDGWAQADAQVFKAATCGSYFCRVDRGLAIITVAVWDAG